MWSSPCCGHCGQEPASPVRCQACLTKFCGTSFSSKSYECRTLKNVAFRHDAGPSCRASSSTKHKAECRDLACLAFGRAAVAHMHGRTTSDKKAWAADMVALSWSMRKEHEALNRGMETALKEDPPPPSKRTV